MDLEKDDIVDILKDLYKQATEDHSHCYTGDAILLAIREILRLRNGLRKVSNIIKGVKI